jgi:hypothetical protein
MVLKKSVCLALSVAALTVAAYAYATVPYSISYGYYADAGFTEYVGGEQLSCNGHRTTWGTVTPYKAEETREACHSGDPYEDPWGN